MSLSDNSDITASTVGRSDTRKRWSGLHTPHPSVNKLWLWSYIDSRHFTTTSDITYTERADIQHPFLILVIQRKQTSVPLSNIGYTGRADINTSF